MNSYLLDTNVPSELSRKQPAQEVADWIRAAPQTVLYISVVSLAEVIHGIERQKDLVRRAHLNHWFESVLLIRFIGRRIASSEPIAERTGQIMAARDTVGIPISLPMRPSPRRP